LEGIGDSTSNACRNIKQLYQHHQEPALSEPGRFNILPLQ